MHVADGILPASVLAGAGAGSAGLAGLLLARLDAERIPRVALCASFFFVASLVHVPVGPASAHLLLIGLVGIIMGPWAFLPILFGVALQALLFGHGGVTAIGVNALTMGLPAYAAWLIFRAGRRLRRPWAPFVFGFLAGWGAVIVSLLLLKAALALADDTFAGVAWTMVIVHQPLAVVEGVVSGSAAAFLQRVEPAILEGNHA